MKNASCLVSPVFMASPLKLLMPRWIFQMFRRRGQKQSGLRRASQHLAGDVFTNLGEASVSPL